MAGNKTENEKPPIIVIKRIKKGGGGHHGGAWKVAYADFVTAMMAFFLLLWLLNVTTEEQKNAISNYFDPSHPKVSDVVSGAGGLLAGMTMSPDGAMVSTVQPIVQPEAPDTTTRGALSPDGKGDASAQGDSTGKDLSEKQLEEELRKKEDERFKAAAEQLKAEIANSPDLKDLMQNLLIDITPEGLRIQIVDDKGRSMFPSGSAAMYDFMRQLLLKVTGVVKPLPNQVSIRGHTDSVKYKDPTKYDNWNLSADRAQASRRVMVTEGGLPEKRVENVMGRADREHLVPADPTNARNRRLTIILLRDRITNPPRPLPGKDTPQTKAEKQQVQEPAKDGKLPGIQIVDDTKPGAPTVAGGSQKQTAPAKAGEPVPAQPLGPNAELPPGYVPLPVSPGGKRTQTGPQSMTFGDAPPKADDLYEGPVQSPYVNKPPTIRTPVFNLDPEGVTPETPAPAPAAPVQLTPVPASQAPAQVEPKSVTFGDVEPLTITKVPAEGPSAVPATPKILTISPELPADMPELQLIQPSKPAAKAEPKSLTFDEPAENPNSAPVPSTPTPIQKTDGKTLTFD